MTASVLLWTRWGRARVCERVNTMVSRQIQGQLVVGEIESISLPRVKARDVRILAPDGVPAIDVESAEIDLDLGSFLAGDFVWHRAEIRNGLVRVTEDSKGRVNMEETFKAREPSTSSAKPTAAGANETASAQADPGELDMRKMVTSNMRLEIGGGDLPSLRLVDIDGIMRVYVAPDGETNIRFDDYRGHFVKGLPHGRLRFEAVKGHVKTDHRRLLRFEGAGQFEGEPVRFGLDILTEPRKRVKIDAFFPEVSAASLSTLGLGVWSKISGDVMEIKVRHGR